MIATIGIIMLVMPFLALFIYLIKTEGIKVAQNISIAVVVISLWLYLAITLIEINYSSTVSDFISPPC